MFDTIKKCIDSWDPYGFLSDVSDNDDEYDIESKSIAKKITKHSTLKDISIIISKIFNSSFSDTRFTVDNCLNVAENIYAEIHTR